LPHEPQFIGSLAAPSHGTTGLSTPVPRASLVLPLDFPHWHDVVPSIATKPAATRIRTVVFHMVPPGDR
jgi:hypothetical protein